MKLEIVGMKTWQSKVLNGVAWVIGIRGEDVWCMTVTKGAAEIIAKDKNYRESYEGDAYCITCKEKREFKGWIRISDSGRRMAQGYCPICNTKVNRILGKA